MQRIIGILKNYSTSLLCVCFLFFTLTSWVLILRDGRALYGFLDFYPQFTPFIKSIEPHLVKWGINSIPTILFIVLTFASFLFYAFSLKAKISLKNTVTYALLFQTIVFFAYPALSTDIFYYIVSDRVSTVHHENVWQKVPIDFPSDKFLQFSDWKNQTKMYGGVNQAIYTIPSVLSGNDLITNLLNYKLIVWIFSLLSIYVLYMVVKNYTHKDPSTMLRLVFWNPLLVLEYFGSGHNDILMIFFFLLSIFFVFQKKWLLGGVALALSSQVKVTSMLVVPFIVVNLIRNKQYKAVVQFIFSFGITNSIIFYLMQTDPITFVQRIMYSTNLYWQSLPGVWHQLFPASLVPFSVLFVLVLMGSFIYQYKEKKEPLQMYAFVLAVYLLIFLNAYWNWYSLWLLFLVPFLSSKKLSLAIVTLTFTSLLAYPIYWVSLRFDHVSILWTIIIYSFIALPVVFTFFLSERKSFRGLL